MDNPFDFKYINDRKTLEDESGLKADNKPQSILTNLISQMDF
jgi:hypothetical protein